MGVKLHILTCNQGGSDCYTYAYTYTCIGFIKSYMHSGVCNNYEKLVCCHFIVFSDLFKQSSASRQTAPHSSDNSSALHSCRHKVQYITYSSYISLNLYVHIWKHESQKRPKIFSKHNSDLC